MTRSELDYKTAFQIACALLNGDILYGTDAESIFSEIMKKDGCVCSFDYENYILTHLNELRDDKALSQQPCEDAIKHEYDTYCSHKCEKCVDAECPLRCEDAISREAVMGLVAREHSEWDDLYIDIAKLPSVTPSINADAIHREREQAYLRGYEDASKKYRQEPCDDAISRQAALDCFTATKLKKFDFILYAREEIKKLPPVILQQKSGKWEDLHRCWVCSECGQETHIEHKYCPNCGADMRGAE